MVWKLSFAVGVVAISGGMAVAQNSAGNILSGDVKADVVKRYNGPETLPKPDKIVIHDFAMPGADITSDESAAARLHRNLMLRHGVDEDSSPEVLAQRVRAAFTKTLTAELQKANIPTIHTPAQKTPATG